MMSEAPVFPIENLRQDIQAGLGRVDVLAERVVHLLAKTQAENVRLQLENDALRAENAFLQGRLAGRGLRLAAIRMQMKALKETR